MRKRIWIPLVALGAAAAAFFGYGPIYLENSMNKVDGRELLTISPEAAALHKTLQIVDLHSDTLLWKRDMVENVGRGHEDLPRLQQGNVTLQVFSSVSKTPWGQNYDSNPSDSDLLFWLIAAQAQPLRTWGSLTERSLWHATKLDRAVARSGGQLAKIADQAGFDALMAARGGAKPPVGALLSIEGLQNLEGKLENLDRLHKAGFRMAGFAHFFDSELAGSMHGEMKGGLTPLGRKVMTRMEELGMIVDIAHCSRQCVGEVLASARRPVVSSHGGVQAMCKVNRNLSDDEIRALARTGGVIGIGYWDGAVCDISPRSIARSIKYVRDLVGIQHVALGSDYDGTTTVRFDTSGLAQVTQALLDEGFTPEEIRAAMGGNALRVIRAGIVPLGAAAPQ